MGIRSYFAVCMSKFWSDVAYLQPSGEPLEVSCLHSLTEFPPLTSAPHRAGLFFERGFFSIISSKLRVVFAVFAISGSAGAATRVKVNPGRIPKKNHNPVK
jgi:hypothetical protein